jgi:hypothetical protein
LKSLCLKILKSLCLNSLFWESLCLKSLCPKSLCMKNLKSRCVKTKSPKKDKTFLVMINKLILKVNQKNMRQKNRRNMPYMMRMAINLKIIYHLDNSEFFILTISRIVLTIIKLKQFYVTNP